MSGAADDDAQCSRSGCREAASRRVNWRNPKIHGTERVKVWFACGEHEQFLYDYLSTRGFPVVVSALDEPVAQVPDGASAIVGDA